MSGNASNDVNELGQCLEFVITAAKGLALIAPRMTPQARQSWIGQSPEIFAELFAKQIFLSGVDLGFAKASSKPAPKKNPYLKKVGTATLSPTKGTVTLAQASDVFTGHIDPDYKRWGTDVPGVDTEVTPVDIFEMKGKNGKYTDLFGSLVGVGENDSYDQIVEKCRPLCQTQGQIVEFARTRRALLRQDGYATFFLFEVSGVLFVADVHVVGGRLKAHVRHFSDGHVWGADYQHRLVVPQQTV